MLVIKDKNGNALNRSSMVFSEDAENANLLFIELRIQNESNQLIVNPGVYITPSSLDGDILSFSNKTPTSMLDEILLSECLELKIGEDLPIMFKKNVGSNEFNKIILAPEIDVSGFFNIKLLFNKNAFDSAEFLYIGLEAK